MSKEFTKEDETSEGMTMKGEAKGMDKEFWESMTKGTGPLVAGALPGMDLVSEQAMAEMLTGGSAAKAKVKKPPRSQQYATVPVQPATLKENPGFTI